MPLDSSLPTTPRTATSWGSGELRSPELSLRNQGCLVFPVSSGDGLWIFSSNSSFDALGTLWGKEEIVAADNPIIVDNRILHSM